MKAPAVTAKNRPNGRRRWPRSNGSIPPPSAGKFGPYDPSQELRKHLSNPKAGAQ